MFHELYRQLAKIQRESNNHGVICKDKFLKYVNFIPTTKDCHKFFVRNIVKYREVPQVILMDRDQNFASMFWSKLFKLFGTYLTFPPICILNLTVKCLVVVVLKALYHHYANALGEVT